MNLFGGHGSIKVSGKAGEGKKVTKGTRKAARKKREKTKKKLEGWTRMLNSW
jgi:hypothetical protein